MGKLLRYELIHPDVDQIKKFQENIGDSHNKILAKRAADSASDIYYLEDEQEKLNQIYRFIYYYLLCYEQTENPPQTSGANELILQNQNEELKRQVSIINMKYEKLLKQTSNTSDSKDISQLQQELEKTKGTLVKEKVQRQNAEEKLTKITAQCDKLVETVEANRNALENYSKLQEDLKKAIGGRDSLAKYANTLQTENDQLKEQLEEFQNSRQGKKMVKAINSSKETKQLQSEINEFQEKNTQLQKQIDTLRSAEEKVSSSLVAKEQLITKLKQDRDNANAAKNKAENDLLLLQQKFDEQKKVLSNAGSARTNLYSESYEKQLKEKDRKIRELEKQLQNPDQLQNLHKKLNPESEWDELPALKVASSAELEKLKTEINELNNQLSQKNVEINQLKNIQIPDNSAEINQLQQKLDALRQENKEIKAAYEELSSKYMNLLLQGEI